MNIPQEFGGINDLLKRWKKAQNNYEDFRSLHQDAFEYAAPNREGFKANHQGQDRVRTIYDDTAVTSLPQFGNRIQSAIMPAWNEWLEFQAGDEIPEQERDVADEALEKLTKQFFSELNQSNFYTELAPALLDLGIGTGALLLEPEEMGKHSMVRFTAIPLHELYPETSYGGPIESVWRKHSLHPKAILKTWPDAKLTADLKSKAEKEDAADVTILNAMLQGKDGKYHQFIIHEESKSLIFHQVHNTKRIIVFRWGVTAGEVFGRGPIIDLLPSIKTVNKIKEMMLQNGALQIAGVYTAVDDGIFNPYTARFAPNSIIPVGSNSNQNPTLMPLARNSDLGFADYLVQDLQNSIKKHLFVGQLGEINDPTKTATEIMIRHQEMLKDAGANFGRLKSELISPLVDAITDIMRVRGKWPEYKVDGRVISIRHVSPIAKAEKLEDYQALQMWLSNILTFVPPEMANLAIKLEEVPEESRKLLGITSRLVRTEEERNQMQTQQAQAMAAKQGAMNGQ